MAHPTLANNSNSNTEYLALHFSDARAQAEEWLTRPYGTAYRHCLMERQITDVCLALGMTFQPPRPILRVEVAHGVSISHTDVAVWFGISAASWATFRTQFRKARDAQQILSARRPPLSESDSAIAHVLDVMLSEHILPPPSLNPMASTRSPPGQYNATKWGISLFMDKVEAVLRSSLP
jgi:hypothetical protein